MTKKAQKKRRPAARLIKATRNTRAARARFKTRKAAAQRSAQTLLTEVTALKDRVDALLHKRLDAKVEHAGEAYQQLENLMPIERAAIHERTTENIHDWLKEEINASFDDAIIKLGELVESIGEAELTES